MSTRPSLPHSPWLLRWPFTLRCHRSPLRHRRYKHRARARRLRRWLELNDRMIAPEYERAAAVHIHATTTTLTSSHVAMLSQPKAVAAVIIDTAAKAAGRSSAH